MHRSRFVIHNDRFDSLTLNLEPEGAFFSLKKGEEVIVIDNYCSSPVTLKMTNSDEGETIISLWPGDGDLRVEKDGVDVFDLLAQPGVVV